MEVSFLWVRASGWSSTGGKLPFGLGPVGWSSTRWK